MPSRVRELVSVGPWQALTEILRRVEVHAKTRFRRHSTMVWDIRSALRQEALEIVEPMIERIDRSQDGPRTRLSAASKGLTVGQAG